MIEPSRHPVAILAYPGVQLLDVTGPFEVFAAAGYPVEVVGLAPGPLASAAGLELVARRSYRAVEGGLDTLLVAGGAGHVAAMAEADLLDWLRRRRHDTRRLGSVCTGAFVLAAAGLLDGRPAVTHWAHCRRFAQLFPTVRLEPDALHVGQDGLYSSAGVSAGIDLALALVEADLGHAAALAVARDLVVFLKRPGGQSQFSSHLMAEAGDSTPMRRVRDWIHAHPGSDLRVEPLAERAGMSPRNFARVFVRETGTTPQRFVEAVRLDAARRRLEQSPACVEAVAADCGFGTAETMRRAFLRRLGVTPHDYRARFRKSGRAEAVPSTEETDDLASA